jgi:ribonuclease R
MSSKKVLDPNAEREAQKYTNPIPSREYILSYLQNADRLLNRKALESALGLETDEAREALRRRLQAMRRDGQLILTRRKGYGLAKKMDLIQGYVIGHKEGFGFVTPEDGSPDLFLNAHQMRQVFPEDSVLVRVTGIDHRGRREACIVDVLARHTRLVVGRYFQEEGIGWIVPTNSRIHQEILIPPDKTGGAITSQIVTVEIKQQPALHRQATGHIIEILGDHLDTRTGIAIAIRNYNLPHEWPAAVQEEIAALKTQLPSDSLDRIDLSALPFVTIDGTEAQDFDDAVYCEPNGNTWRLWVAIADVSHYVRSDTALDQAAKLRGTSVYFPGTVIPMLPEILSNDWCSLKPKVKRFCLVCDMTISAKGQLKAYHFYPAVICSQARLSYEAVSHYLETGHCTPQHQFLLPHLQHLQQVYQALTQAKLKRGAIDFNIQEPQIHLTKNGDIHNIIPLERSLAHRIIEECMLAANVAAAQFLLNSQLPSLFRIHEPPPPDKLDEFKTFLANLGLRLSIWRKQPKPTDYARLLTATTQRRDSRLIQTLILRAMSQAVYSPHNKGHFGLAFSEYTHFTSPIRRYPDLIVHRTIRYALSKSSRKKFYYDQTLLTTLGEHCSMTERRADEASREVLTGLKCAFMQAHLGKRFHGIISHVTGFGLFIALKDNLIEGLVPVSTLKNDYYHFDNTRLELKGERRGTVYRIGDPVRIQVVKVDLEAKQIDFELL